jgi:hypothetical protein
LRLISVTSDMSDPSAYPGHVCFGVSRHVVLITIQSTSAWTCNFPAY